MSEREQTVTRRRPRGARPGAGQVRLADVARFVGVSTATVSRALSRPEAVSGEVRGRVEAAVRQLGWVPHAAARALATRRNHTIGAIIPNISQENFAEAIQSMQEELARHNHTLLLACSEYDADSELRLARSMVERGLDALALVGEAHHPDLPRMLAGQSIPFVNTFTFRADAPHPCIGVDNYRAMFQLTSRLLDLGHTRFGMIAQRTRFNDRASARLNAVKDALAVRSLEIFPEHLTEGSWQLGEGRALFRAIMQSDPRPTAVIGANGYLAVGAALEAAALGLRVPQDVSIVGFDDLQLMAELPVPITTVGVPSADIGRRAARYLLARLERLEFAEALECPANLLLRASAAAPPGHAVTAA